MTIFPLPGQPSNRGRAISCALTNLLVMPGLGSLLAGRYLVGISQSLLSLGGSGFLLAWFFKVMLDYYSQMTDQPRTSVPHGWIGLIGVLVFVASWLWALVTSIQIFRSVPKNLPGSLPPRLD